MFSDKGQNLANILVLLLILCNIINRTATKQNDITTDTVHTEISVPKSLQSKHKQQLRKQNKSNPAPFVLQIAYRNAEMLTNSQSST